jgi:hypothetical protein
MDVSAVNLHSPQRQWMECQMAHADLDALIDQAVQMPLPLDELLLRRLKKRHLVLRDQMSRLQCLLDPKEPA